MVERGSSTIDGKEKKLEARVYLVVHDKSRNNHVQRCIHHVSSSTRLARPHRYGVRLSKFSSTCFAPFKRRIDAITK